VEELSSLSSEGEKEKKKKLPLMKTGPERRAILTGRGKGKIPALGEIYHPGRKKE